MALGKCRECGNTVSSMASACPHCGAPTNAAPAASGHPFATAKAPTKRRKNSSSALGCLVLVGLVVVVAFFGYRSVEQAREQARAAEQTRRASLTPEQRAAEDKAKQEAEVRRAAEAATAAKAREEAEAKRAAEAEAKRKEQEKQGDESEAKVMAEEFVKKSLKYPDDAEFNQWGTDQDAGLTEPINGQRHWVVDGKVKAANALGAKLTHTYKVQLYRTGGKSNWALVGLWIDGEQKFWKEPTASAPIRGTTQQPKDEWREWTGSDGGLVMSEGKFIKFENSKVHLEYRDGAGVSVSMSALSSQDQKYIRDKLKDLQKARDTKTRSRR